MKKWFYPIVGILLCVIVYNELTRKSPKRPVRKQVAENKAEVPEKKKTVYSESSSYSLVDGEGEIKLKERIVTFKKSENLRLFIRLSGRYDVFVIDEVTAINLVKVQYSSEAYLNELIAICKGTEVGEATVITIPKPVPSNVGLSDAVDASLWFSEDEKSGEGVLIAVIDSGVINRKAFKGKVSHISLIESGSAITDSHGTAVASLILGDKSIGVSGVAPKAKILDIRVFDNDVPSNGYVVAKGIVLAVENGAHVINLSLGGEKSSTIVKSAVDFAIDNNVVVVAASGNESADKVGFPARYEEVIAVGAVDKNRVYANKFSNRGANLDLVALGNGVKTAEGVDGVAVKSGTSFACPLVAGLIAHVKSKYPQSSNQDIINSMYEYSDDLGMQGKDIYYGLGIPNLTRIDQGRGVYDVAAAGAGLRTNDDGSISLIVSGENRGSEAVKSLRMKVSWLRESETFYFRNIQPNETFFEECPGYDHKKVNYAGGDTVSIEIIPDFVDDINQGNDDGEFTPLIEKASEEEK